MVYDLLRALPGVRDLIVTVARNRLAHLAPAQGCQDHTLSPSARTSLVSRCSSRPPLPASTSQRLNVCDDASAPLAESGWREVYTFSVFRKEKFLARRDRKAESP